MRLFGSIELGPLRLGASVRPRIFRRRRPRPHYIHYGCPIHHRSARTADRCPNGRI